MPALNRDQIVALLAAYPILVALILIASVVAPQRGGPLGLAQVFAPHLLVPVLLLAPIALVTSSRTFRLGVAVAVALGMLRFGSGLVSLPPQPVAADELVVRIVSWNLEAGAPAVAGVVDKLRTTDADIVAFQELTPDHAAAIQSDPGVAARFPHLALVPRTGVGGIGLISRFPILSAAEDVNPVIQEVALELAGRQLTVINSHPFPPRYRVLDVLPLPFAYDPSVRDADVLRIRESIDRVIAAGRPVVIFGDFNLTDREPAFAELSEGLWDAHLDVGQGIGSTWRPSRLEFLPFGILRIDHFLGGPGARPLTVGEDCTPMGSDHCLLFGEAAIAGG